MDNLQNKQLIFNEAEDDILFTNESKPEFIYKDLTLDEIIAIKKQFHAPREGDYDAGGGVHYGIDDTASGAPRISPVFMIRLLSEDGKLVEMEAQEMELGDKGLKDFRAHRWRVIWTHKSFQGVGEAPRKVMASQVAAFDLLEKLRNEFPDYNLPECEIPRGCLINPFLFTLVEDKCGELECGPPEYQLKATLNSRGKKHFIALCFVGDEVYVGNSYDSHYAKRFAVKQAFERITGRVYPDDKIFRGANCSKHEKYNNIESEVNHVYVLYDKPAKRVRYASSRQESGKESLGSTTDVVTLRPPRLRPPPIIIPPYLNLNLQPPNPAANRIRSFNKVDDQKWRLPYASRDLVVVEHPDRYGEVDDEDDTDGWVYGDVIGWVGGGSGDSNNLETI